MSARDAAALGASPGRSVIIEGDGASVPQHFTAGKPRPEPKIARVLAGLLAGPKTTRELELSPYCDHCGHSTAADLRRLGVAIEAERVEIRGFAGLPAYVARYSVRHEGYGFACALLERMRGRRRGPR